MREIFTFIHQLSSSEIDCVFDSCCVTNGLLDFKIGVKVNSSNVALSLEAGNVTDAIRVHMNCIMIALLCCFLALHRKRDARHFHPVDTVLTA
jgi:hypothetical protein